MIRLAAMLALAIVLAWQPDKAGAGPSGGFAVGAETVTEDELRNHVVAAFNERYADLYYRNPLDGQYFPVPKISPAELKVIEETADHWRLLREPLVGMTVRARVEKRTGVVEFLPLEFAYE